MINLEINFFKYSSIYYLYEDIMLSIFFFNNQANLRNKKGKMELFRYKKCEFSAKSMSLLYVIQKLIGN